MDGSEEIIAQKNIKNVLPVTRQKAMENNHSEGLEGEILSYNTEDKEETGMMNPLLEYIDTSIIGRETMFNSPYGLKRGMRRKKLNW